MDDLFLLSPAQMARLSPQALTDKGITPHPFKPKPENPLALRQGHLQAAP